MTTANDKPTGKAPAKKAAPARLAPAISALAANRPNLRAAGAPAASQGLSPLMGLESGEPTDFVTEEGSPFADGYSIKGERQVLAPLLTSDEPDEAHPLYPRLMLLERRERELQQLRLVVDHDLVLHAIDEHLAAVAGRAMRGDELRQEVFEAVALRLVDEPEGGGFIGAGAGHGWHGGCGGGRGVDCVHMGLPRLCHFARLSGGRLRQASR